MMRNLMKWEVYKFSKGKYEIVAMDDELPIVIFIVLCCNLPYLLKEFQMLSDFVRFDDYLQYDSMIITSLNGAVEFIKDEKSWKFWIYKFYISKYLNKILILSQSL